MSMMKKASEALQAVGPSLKSMAKMAIQSRPVRSRLRKAGRDACHKPLIIMGNGPSLRDDIEQHLQQLAQGPAMAVNFAANTPEFGQIRPAFYTIIDPLFFASEPVQNVQQLWQNIAAVDWPMALIIPCKEQKRIPAEVRNNPNITLAPINPVGVEGWAWLERKAYSSGLGMPRPRNVLIPSIMAAISMGFKEIYLCGADHSWLRTISVDDDNCVVSIQPHFYKDDEKELTRIRKDYMHYPLHQILQSFYIAFAAYHRLQRFAKKYGVSIYNATPGSYIDAFERRTPWL